MSEGLNRVTLIGNLGADPEVRFTQGGQAVCNLRMACTETYLDKDKERQERTEWVRVVIWGPRGEAMGKLLAKGSRICVEGRLQTTTYDKDGEKRYSTDVVSTNIVLLDGKRPEKHDDADDDGREAPREGRSAPRGGARDRPRDEDRRPPARDTRDARGERGRVAPRGGDRDRPAQSGAADDFGDRF